MQIRATVSRLLFAAAPQLLILTLTAVTTARASGDPAFLQQQHAFPSPLAAEGSTGSIEIKALNVPERLENGTKESIILDCVYSFDEKKDKMLVVKWFLNDDTTPIYQWIVELGTRSVVQRLMGRIDTNYAVPGASPHTRYRAIRLLNPTTDLSGRYKCNVQSIRGEQNRAKTMIIYAAPKNVSFALERLSTQRKPNVRMPGSPPKHTASSATNREMMALAVDSKQRVSQSGAVLKCSVENVFPKPDLRLYGIRRDGSRYLLPDTVRQEKAWTQSRAHSVYLSAQVYDADVLRQYNEDSGGMIPGSEDSDSADPRFQHPYHYNQERQEVRTVQKPPHQPPPLSRQSFQFECVSSVDVRGPTNLTKAVALTYTPSEETKNFFRSSTLPVCPSLTSGFLLLLASVWLL